MCGIAGIFSYRSEASPVDAAALVRIRDHMVRRGPDGAGLWISSDRRGGLANRRLAIIDFSEIGAQPMASEDGRLQVTFNGEIYNHRELRAGLEAKGHVFRSQSDTEVLLHLYAEHGEDMVHRLRGMYAFAIWDGSRQALFLARDPFGIKPLYYHSSGQQFFFASQVKALLAHGGLGRSSEAAGYAGFLLWGFVPEPYTLYQDVFALPAGTALWVTRRGLGEPKPFFDIAQILAGAEQQPAMLTPAEAHEALRSAVLDSVRHHLIADVPVGVFLSAGLDSTTLTALAAEQQTDLRTFTLGFREYQGHEHDEVPLAEAVARQYCTQHVTRWIDKDKFLAERDALLAAMDQPSIDGVNMYFVSKTAAESGLKVAISGLGGDELFGGYPSFRQIPKLVHAVGTLPGVLQRRGRGLRTLSAPILKMLTSPKYASLLEYGASYGGSYLLRRGLFMPWEIEDVMDASLAREALEKLATIPQLDTLAGKVKRPNLKVSLLEATWYMRSQLLRDADWASMAHSLEVRVPLLDIELLRTLAPLRSLKNPVGKKEFARIPQVPLPPAVLGRRKTGFSVPVRDWLADTMRGKAQGRGLRSWALALIDRSMAASEQQWMLPRPPILVFRIGQLGDTLVALPALAHLHRNLPGQRLLLLTDRHGTLRTMVSAWDVVSKTGWVDGVITYDADLPPLEALRERLQLARNIRGLRVARVISLSPHRNRLQRLRDYIVFRALLGIPQVDGVWSGSLNRPRRVIPLPRLEPEWMRLLTMAQTCLGGARPNEFRLSLAEDERHRACSLLAARGIPGHRPLLAVGAGSKMPAKVWPGERYVEVLQLMQQRFPSAAVVFLGGADESDYCRTLADKVGPRAINLAGELSIPGSAAILEQCDAYLGNDTGIMHLAASVGTPCVAIFSARDFPGLWEPMGSGHRILRHETDCAGCMLVECKAEGMRCLTAISTDQVWRELLAVLEPLSQFLPQGLIHV